MLLCYQQNLSAWVVTCFILLNVNKTSTLQGGSLMMINLDFEWLNLSQLMANLLKHRAKT